MSIELEGTHFLFLNVPLFLQLLSLFSVNSYNCYVLWWSEDWKNDLSSYHLQWNTGSYRLCVLGYVATSTLSEGEGSFIIPSPHLHCRQFSSPQTRLQPSPHECLTRETSSLVLIHSSLDPIHCILSISLIFFPFLPANRTAVQGPTISVAHIARNGKETCQSHSRWGAWH